ncbi:YdbC family protein [Lacticigenium naphthae]|uniref:YdbC family protein n=1 Tax=Lacticigenium naphthae TaxID=515351 RepID=UPI0003FD87D2|nr:PC4/YdbC family ssDNA-binding protein [Lacticigenium naphthae]
MATIEFEIKEALGELSRNEKGWTKEVNRVSWNGREPKIDIRSWDPTHEKMGKGITLTEEEWTELQAILTQLNVED